MALTAFQARCGNLTDHRTELHNCPAEGNNLTIPCGLYAQAARQGAPQAKQVADRCCHVNLSAIGEGIALVGSSDVRSRFPDIKCLQPMEADG